MTRNAFTRVRTRTSHTVTSFVFTSFTFTPFPDTPDNSVQA